MALPAKWSTVSKKLSRRCRNSCLTTAGPCGNGLKKDLPLREWPKIM